jgi:hypothetical protein
VRGSSGRRQSREAREGRAGATGSSRPRDPGRALFDARAEPAPSRQWTSGDAQAELAPALRAGKALAVIFLAVGVLLLALAAVGRGLPYLLGAIDFVVIGAILYWVARPRRTRF